MTLKEAKSAAQARATQINGVVSIRRLAPRRFDLADDNTPFDPKVVIIVHPSWITDGTYKRLGWPEPATKGIL